MAKALFSCVLRRLGVVPLVQISLSTLGCLLLTSDISFAQVTSDGTVNTQVNQNGNVAEITGGERAGDNLFHSFQDFSVGTGDTASFLNANDIANIFSRVTGGNISNIDGLISANGSANLFLINPAGILFGENARLDVGGSFLGSTADSILFEDGEFSATDLENPPVLTINAPIGLNLRDNPEPIINRSFVQNSAEETVGLEVLPGNNLAFVGGNINFEAGEATASGGNIELGGLTEAGIVTINPDGSLSFPDDVIKADINLSNAADVDVRGTGGGNVTVNARNLNLTAGEFGSSFIRAGIGLESTNPEAQAGDVTINVADNLTLDESGIANQVGGVGDAGNITINTGSLEAINGGFIGANTFGQGNAGSVDITATSDITLDGEDSQGLPSGVENSVGTDAVGSVGVITISTTKLTMTNGGRVTASTFGQGDAGAVNITARGDITADGEDSDGSQSGITSLVETDAVGDAGGVTISTTNLNLTNGGRVWADTFGQGNAGAVKITATDNMTFDGEDSEGIPSGVSSQVTSSAEGNSGGVTIFTTNLNLTNGGQVDASTFGQGNAGAINITASGDITADGEDLGGSPSGITSQVDTFAVGDAGGVTITTTNLSLTNGGQVDASTFGQGDAGAVKITASGDLTFDGESSGGSNSGAKSRVEEGAEGNAKGVTITTSNLTLTNGAVVDASTLGKGDAGAVDIIASGNIIADGENSGGFQSGITSQVDTFAEGNSEGVTISTTNLNLTKGGRVDASTLGQGDAGAVKITATGDITADGENSAGFNSGITSLVTQDAVGNAGGVTISTTNLNLTKGGRVETSTFGQGNAGDITIDARESIFISGVEDFRIGISAAAIIDNGNGGDVNINTDQLTITNNGIIEAGNSDFQKVYASGTGQPGIITINANNLDLIDRGAIGATTLSTTDTKGIINLNIAEDITLRDNSFISAQAFGEADGGNLNIDARFIVAYPSNGVGNDLVATADDGQGGNITLDAEQIFGLETGEAINDKTNNFIKNNNNDLDASSRVLGLDGTVNINTSRINPVQGATELPTNIVEAEQTTDQACQADRETAAKNGLVINGKGGIPAPPDQPLTSQNLIIDGEVTSAYAIPEPIETAKGKIQLARGIKVTKDGEIILTPYPTNNAGERIPVIKRNCI
jgi:filamentous hemagglutinin family protein